MVFDAAKPVSPTRSFVGMNEEGKRWFVFELLLLFCASRSLAEAQRLGCCTRPLRSITDSVLSSNKDVVL